jgi:hypothetical protein
MRPPFDGGVKQQFQRCANRGLQSVMGITKRLSLLSVYRATTSSNWGELEAAAFFECMIAGVSLLFDANRNPIAT